MTATCTAGISAPADASADLARQILIHPRRGQSVTLPTQYFQHCRGLDLAGTMIADTGSQKRMRSQHSFCSPVLLDMRGGAKCGESNSPCSWTQYLLGRSILLVKRES